MNAVAMAQGEFASTIEDVHEGSDMGDASSLVDEESVAQSAGAGGGGGLSSTCSAAKSSGSSGAMEASRSSWSPSPRARLSRHVRKAASSAADSLGVCSQASAVTSVASSPPAAASAAASPLKKVPNSSSASAQVGRRKGCLLSNRRTRLRAPGRSNAEAGSR